MQEPALRQCAGQGLELGAVRGEEAQGLGLGGVEMRLHPAPQVAIPLHEAGETCGLVEPDAVRAKAEGRLTRCGQQRRAGEVRARRPASTGGGFAEDQRLGRPLRSLLVVMISPPPACSASRVGWPWPVATAAMA